MPPDFPAQTKPQPPALRVGIDIGGTFTDFVVYSPAEGTLQTFKLLSTPVNPAEAVLSGVERIRQAYPSPTLALHVIHGSTVATNALLERKGARTAFVATRGFADILQIGRQNRPALYDFFADPPPPLVPDGLRFEVAERVDNRGQVLEPLDRQALPALVAALRLAGAESAAVCLLFSFLHPQHEAEIGAALRQAGFSVSLSSEILPEYREYERASTTAVNAYVSPVLERYLAHLQANSAGALFRVMQSNGGSISLEEARKNGVRCILSGPAGGVVGARYVGGSRLITFDMGGTSTDVSLIDLEPQVTSEAVVGGCPIRIPILDIHTIGAGGGSLARVDAGGALRVGPESAGAVPGPACYGRGTEPTVTDANLVLGRLAPEWFLGGQMPLHAARAWQALERLGAALGLSAVQAALGVVEVANAHMERALRVISVERGYDPQGGGGLPPFTLLSFGGAGGLHAADLARRLGIPRVLVPPLASTLSAFGMLAASVVKDYTQTVMLPGDTSAEELAARLAPLSDRGREEVLAEGVPPADIVLEEFLDMRYLGQSYELTVPFLAGQDFHIAFHAAHARTYGYARAEAEVEIVNLRLRLTGRAEPPPLPAMPEAGPDSSPAFLATRPAVVSRPPGGNSPGDAQPVADQVPFYQGEALQPGNRLSGPAIILRSDTSILVGPEDEAWIDPYRNVLIEIGAMVNKDRI